VIGLTAADVAAYVEGNRPSIWRSVRGGGAALVRDLLLRAWHESSHRGLPMSIRLIRVIAYGWGPGDKRCGGGGI
jgi:hypothetical protein